MSSECTFITNGRVVTLEGVLDNHVIVIRGGSIDQIISVEKFEKEWKQQDRSPFDEIDAEGGLITPAFCDAHIHGCYYWGFDHIDKHSFEQIEEHLQNRGITTFLPTIQYDEKILSKLVEVLETVPTDRVPGIYIEGPFVNSEKKGGLRSDSLAVPSEELLRHIISLGRGKIKMMTIAPELMGIQSIVEMLVDSGIIPCFGHAVTTFKDAQKLYRDIQNYKPGTTVSMTHLFNASSGLTHRAPGLSLLAFLEDIMFEVNGDGVHIDDDMLRFLLHYGDESRMMLISDAIISAGLPSIAGNEGNLEYHGIPILRKETNGGVYDKQSGTLLGSSFLLDEIVTHMAELCAKEGYEAAVDHEHCDAIITRIIRASCTNPCTLLGIDDKKGSIAPGKVAELLIMDAALHVKKVLV